MKSEQNLRNILKSPKRNFTNNFVRNPNIYSKGYNQIQTISRPFKGALKTFRCFWGKNTMKTDHKLKNISKYDKNSLNNNFVKNRNIYFKQQK